MISSLSSNLLLVSFPSVRNLAFSPNFSLRFDFPPISHTRLFSSSIDVAIEVDKDDSFTASYLLNSCGLSPESAKLVSKYIQLKDASNPDSVLDCFRNYGFSDAHIKKVVRWYPTVLKLNAETKVKPKMEFFHSNGVKDDDLVAIICRSPTLLGSSLNNKIIPFYDFLKRVLVHDKLVVKAFRNGSWGWNMSLGMTVVQNFELLKKIGVPDSRIQFLLINSSEVFCLDTDEFSKRVNQIISIGFDPSKYVFVEAMRRWPKKSTLKRKAEVFRSWGWSDYDIWSAFRKNPAFMHTSEEKIAAVMDFMVNKMGWDSSVVSAAPCVFKFSLEKVVIPKCSVIRALQFKGLIGENIPLNSTIVYRENRFLNMYVFKYLEQVPQLLDIYEGKVDLSKLGFGKLDRKLE